jgi:hypothetical protein
MDFGCRGEEAPLRLAGAAALSGDRLAGTTKPSQLFTNPSRVLKKSIASFLNVEI